MSALVAGTNVNMEGAVPTEQEINQPKPSKRARTSFTADQLQVDLHPHIKQTDREIIFNYSLNV